MSTECDVRHQLGEPRITRDREPDTVAIGLAEASVSAPWIGTAMARSSPDVG